MRTRATELEPLSRSTSGLLVVVGRGQLTDRAWARIEPLLPVSGRGRRWRDHWQVLFPERHSEDELRQISENRGRPAAPSGTGLANERDLSAEQRH